jgi:hypothetical protein
MVKKRKPIVVKLGKLRNPLAVLAHFQTGSGKHKDKRKAHNKNKCRGKVQYD